MKFAARKAQVLIVGYGNVTRGDDGVGVSTAQRLGERVFARGVEIKACHQLTPELAEEIADASLVIFADASVELNPGEIRCLPMAQVSSTCLRRTHHLNPQSLLQLAHELYGKCPRAYVFTIGGEFFGFREGLSDTVSESQCKLIQQIEELIDA